MSNTAWQAFYYHGFDNSHPPARTELIEAPSEDEAAKIATSHMGRCKRVDIAAPRWEPQQDMVILAQDRSVRCGRHSKVSPIDFPVSLRASRS